MSKRTQTEDGFYDSAFGLPDFSKPQPPPLKLREVAPANARSDRSVAITVDTPELRAQVVRALSKAGLVAGGPDSVSDAALILVQLHATDVRVQLEALRSHARPDAAIIAILTVADASAVREAHEAGAFACLRPPLVAEELLGHVGAALDSRHALNQVADLTQRLDMEAHLASIGRMSAGLAHEIGSPLQAALWNVDSMMGDWSRVRELVSTLASSASASAAHARADLATVEDIGANLTDTLGALQKLQAVLGMMRGLMGRERTVRQERVDLRQIIQEARKILQHELVGVELEVIEEPVFVLVDPTLLGQMVQNLTANAIHAAKSLSSPRVRIHVYAADGMAVVSVRDNGPGIAPELQERIFEPFYTTRRGRGGTGLGLALCREYARQMDASLSLWSMPGRGACFRLSLPTARS